MACTSCKLHRDTVHVCNMVDFFLFFQSFTGDDGVGGVSPNGRLFSQSYPSIYSSGAVTGQGDGHNGEREREKGALEAEQGRRRSGIVDLEEACEDEEEEEDMDERRPYGNESAGEERCRQTVSLNAFVCSVLRIRRLLLLQGSSPWTRTLCPETASRSLSLTGRRRALMVRVCYAD